MTKLKVTDMDRIQYIEHNGARDGRPRAVAGGMCLWVSRRKGRSLLLRGYVFNEAYPDYRVQ